MVPDARLLPLLEPAPAGHPASEDELAREVASGDAGMQDEEDSLQGLSIGEAPSSSWPASLWLWQ